MPPARRHAHGHHRPQVRGGMPDRRREAQEGRELRCPGAGGGARATTPRGARRWRALDLCSTMCFLEYAPCRVRSRARRARGGGPLGRRLRVQVHGRLRGAGVALRQLQHQDGLRAHAGRLAHRGRHMRARGGQAQGGRGALQAGRLRRIGIDETSYTKGHATSPSSSTTTAAAWSGAPGPRQGDARLLLRAADPGSARLHRGRDQGRRPVDSRRGLGVVPNAEQVMDPFHASSG